MDKVFANDPFVRIWEVFRTICPDKKCSCFWVEELEDGAYGMTIFPEDGGKEPHVYVSADLPVKHAAEIFAHELAHVAAGEAADHGPAWEEAFDAIHRGYMGGQAAPQEHPKEFTLTIDRSEHIWLKAGILRAIQSDLEILEGLNRKKPRNVELIRSNVEYLRGKLRLYDKLEAAAHPDERDNPMERYRMAQAMKKSANVCAFSGG